MLILSRKQNQKIRIGNDIVISIVSISENNVRIGIEADPNVKIFRDEIYESVKEHTKQAAGKVELPTNIRSYKINKFNKNAKKN